jgi:O-antigen/teichoic acid export membrane protein
VKKLNLIQRLSGEKTVKNALWIIFERVFQMLLALVVGLLTARYLGPSNYGVLNYTESFVAFATSIAMLGMDSVAVKKIVDHPEEEGCYLGSCMLFRFISSILTSIAVSFAVYLLNPGEPLKVVLVIIQSFQLIFRSVQILDAWFKRYLKSKYVSIGRMIASVVVSAYKIFLLATAKNIIWFAVSNTLSDFVISLMLYIFYKRESTKKLSVEISRGREVLSESYHFILSGLMVAIYGQMDKIMIGQMMNSSDVGLYATATAICGVWVFVPVAIIDSFSPKIMELKSSGDEENYMRRLLQMYSGVIWLCLGVSLIISIFAKPIVYILYGEAYMGAVGALRIAIWYETFSMIGTARGTWVLCEKKNRYVKHYLAIGAVANLIMNSVMIPLWGINGAAVATLITQIITSMIAPLLFKETRVHTKLVLKAFCFKWD